MKCSIYSSNYRTYWRSFKYRKDTNHIMYVSPKPDPETQLLQSKSRHLNSDYLSWCTDCRAVEEKRVEVEENGSRRGPPSRKLAIKCT